MVKEHPLLLINIRTLSKANGLLLKFAAFLEESHETAAL